MKKQLALIAFLCLLLSCEKTVETQTVVLANDGYTSNGSSTFINTFIAGEEVGVTLGPLANHYTVTHIRFLFGGTGNNTVNRTVILKVYKDNGSVNPGALLFSGEYTFASSNSVMQEVDLTSEKIKVDGGGSIRIAFELLDGTGFPSFAQEFDGVYLETKNWIKESNGTWKSNDGIGLNGNWVIRAVVEEEV